MRYIVIILLFAVNLNAQITFVESAVCCDETGAEINCETLKEFTECIQGMISVQDTECIDLEYANGVISATPIIAPLTPGGNQNQLNCGSSGLYVARCSATGGMSCDDGQDGEQIIRGWVQAPSPNCVINVKAIFQGYSANGGTTFTTAYFESLNYATAFTDPNISGFSNQNGWTIDVPEGSDNAELEIVVTCPDCQPIKVEDTWIKFGDNGGAYELTCEDLEAQKECINNIVDVDAAVCDALEDCEIEWSQITGVPNLGTDDQTLTYDRETKRLSIENGNSVDLTLYPTWTLAVAPTVTTIGTYTINLQQVLETDTEWYTRLNGDCREKYYFHYRVRGVHAAGNNWGIIDVPNIAGWDRDIFDVGTYRQSGNTNNPDNPTQGAMPDAPYMGNEAHHWSNSGRIYLNQSSLRDNAATIWVEFTVEYKRN